MVEEKVLALHQFLLNYENICSAHSVDFFVCNHWENVVPQEWRSLEQLPAERVFLGPETALDETGSEVPASLLEFFHEARDLRLDCLRPTDVPPPIANDYTSQPVPTCPRAAPTGTQSYYGEAEPSSRGLALAAAEEDTVLSSFGMNKKKAHEVRQFAKCVAREMAAAGITQLLDVGSGKGYLSQHLALCYRLSVVGVDCSHGNTAGARKRNKKVHKVWLKSSSKNLNPQQVGLPLPTNSHLTDSRHRVEEELGLERMFEHLSAEDSPEGKIHMATESIREGSMMDIKGQGASGSNDKLDSSVGYGKGSYHMSAQRHDASSSQQQNSHTYKPHDYDDTSSFTPVTMEMTPSNIPGLLRTAAATSKGTFSPGKPFGIVGLHTCGDLACSALRAFATAPEARAVCVVGCCYHHITEGSSQGELAGFPMSRQLRELGACLGRTTRMLACQTITKFTNTTTGDSLRGIFWRAVLQVVFARKFPDVYSTRATSLVTGRMKIGLPEDFVSYARHQIGRVKLSNSQVCDAEIRDIEVEFLPRLFQLEFYLKLRAVLAPCIESLIVLDRLLFLQDLDGVKGASIRAVFDPFISPRCVALIAHKNRP